MKTFIFEKFIIKDKIIIDDSISHWIDEFDKSISVSKSNKGGWQSNLLKEVPAILSEQIQDSIKRNFDVKLNVVSYWVNINYPGSSNSEHIHPSSSISGCLYVKVPKNSGNIVFVDKEFTSYDYMCGRKNIYSIEAFDGDILFFKSNLPHYVEENLSDSNRISIAFNCDVEFLREGQGPKQSHKLY